MGLVLLLLLLALVFGGLGLLVEGLKWVLIIAVVLFIAGALSGVRARPASLSPARLLNIGAGL